MNLHIKNFGGIKEGTINISKQFYTFVGYNNSGKTYVSHLLWSIFNNNSISQFLETEKFDEYKIETLSSLKINKEIVNSIFTKYATFIKYQILPKTFNVEVDHFILKDLELIFEIDLTNLEQGEISASSGIQFNEQQIQFIELKKEKKSLLIHFKDIDINSLPKNYKISKKEFSNNIKQYRQKVFINSILNSSINGGFNDTIFLPSERKSYTVFYKYFFRIEKERRKEISDFISNQFLMIEKKKKEKLDLKQLKSIVESPYTQPADELLSKMYKLNEERNENKFDKIFLKELENILGGEIITSENEDKSSISFNFKIKKNSHELKMNLSSSSINQLSALYFYFKYWMKETNNFLIIDEPEENLHPKNQISLVELLIKFSNIAQNKVIIATHSPLVTEIINNYLILGQLDDKEKVAKELGLSDTFLNPETTGLYFFNGETIQEYTASTYGTIFIDFKKEQDKINNIGESLGELMYNQIQNRKKK